MLFYVIFAAVGGLTPYCPLEKAIYEQRSSAIVAAFRPIDAIADWPSGLAVRMRFAKSAPERWWLLWRGGSAGGQFLASTKNANALDWHYPSPDNASDRPVGDVTLIAFDADRNVLTSPLASGIRAPAFLLIPDLREALWYRASEELRVSESGQIFDLVGCDEAKPERTEK